MNILVQHVCLAIVHGAQIWLGAKPLEKHRRCIFSKQLSTPHILCFANCEAGPNMGEEAGSDQTLDSKLCDLFAS